jgi:hypothetical protein
MKPAQYREQWRTLALAVLTLRVRDYMIDTFSMEIPFSLLSHAFEIKRIKRIRKTEAY